MKKLLVLILSVLLILGSTATVFAGSAGSSGATSCKAGDTITVTFSCSMGELTSLGGKVTTSNCTIESVKSVASNVMTSKFDKTKDTEGNEAILFNGPTKMSGNAIQVTVKAGSVGTGSVKVDFIGKDNRDGSVSETASKTHTFKIECAQHNFTETKVEPTCTEKGSVKKVCSVCGTEETTELAALGHKVGEKTTTKEPTCTEKGVSEGKCSVCGETVKTDIKEKGHKLGEYVKTSDGDCMHKGTEAAVCSVCNETVTRETELGSHQFESPVLVQEATISKPEIYEGKCKVCGETTQQIGKCKYTDVPTGMEFECEVGTFPEGTEMGVTEITDGNEAFADAIASLDGLSDDFHLYDIDPSVAGTTVNPDGTVTIQIPIPEGYGKNVAVYLIGEDGSIESLGGKIAADGSTITVKAENAGRYALAYLNGGRVPLNPGDDGHSALHKGLCVWAYAALGELLLILFLLLFKKKKKDEEEM